MDTNEIIMLVIYLVVYPIRVFYCYKELTTDKTFLCSMRFMNGEERVKRQVFWIAIFVSLIWPFELAGQLVINIVRWIYNKFNKLVVSKLIKFLDNMIDK